MSAFLRVTPSCLFLSIACHLSMELDRLSADLDRRFASGNLIATEDKLHDIVLRHGELLRMFSKFWDTFGVVFICQQSTFLGVISNFVRVIEVGVSLHLH